MLAKSLNNACKLRHRYFSVISPIFYEKLFQGIPFSGCFRILLRLHMNLLSQPLSGTWLKRLEHPEF